MNDAYEKRVQNQFGGFCTKVLKNEARHIQREYARQREREMSIEDLISQELEQTAHEDKYFSRAHIFEVYGLPVVVVGDALATAISQLSLINQEVILKSYFLNMTDREISEQIGVCRQSITKRRNGALTAPYALAEGRIRMKCLIPMSVIYEAMNGDDLAISAVIAHYRGYIRYLSRRPCRDALCFEHLYVDEDAQRRLESKLIYAVVTKFKILKEE